MGASGSSGSFSLVLKALASHLLWISAVGCADHGAQEVPDIKAL